jgi:hypothetical protein
MSGGCGVVEYNRGAGYQSLVSTLWKGIDRDEHDLPEF